MEASGQWDDGDSLGMYSRGQALAVGRFYSGGCFMSGRSLISRK
jgi:hypothetical protein